MISGHVFIATSLDGFIARPDGGLDWLEHPGAGAEDHGYGAFVAGIDGILMGRATFEVVARFDPWPYDRPLIVLSAHLGPDAIPPALRDRVTLARTLPEARAEAARRGWRRVWIDGGATIRSCLEAGLVADMVITRIPVLIGQGVPLFGPQRADIRLRHEGTRAFASGLVQSRYAVLP
ncbi:MAG: dihydrofolate reductase family protein [Gemmobacter sp.]